MAGDVPRLDTMNALHQPQRRMPARTTHPGLAPSRPAAEPLLRDWLAAHGDTLFRWTMARLGDAQARRGLAEVAVSMQRLYGRAECLAWLYGAALHAAQCQARQGGLAEPMLAGLAPELRALLRLVARGALPPQEAMALLGQPMGPVRRRLLRTRLKPDHQDG